MRGLKWPTTTSTKADYCYQRGRGPVVWNIAVVGSKDWYIQKAKFYLNFNGIAIKFIADFHLTDNLLKSIRGPP